MKTLGRHFLLLAAILSPQIASAELLIYKGTETETVAGEYNGAHYSLRLIYIVDHDSANIGRITYYTLNGNKRHSKSTLTDAHFVTVPAANGKAYTVVARVPTDCEAQSDRNGEGVYFAGLNATLKTSTNATAIFPRVFVDSGNGLSFSTRTGDPLLVRGSLSLAFNQAETVRSNQAGETLEDALDRLGRYVESLGFVN